MSFETVTTHATNALAQIVWLRVVLFCLVTLGIWWFVGTSKRSDAISTGVARKINHIWVLVGGAVWFGWLPELQARPSMLMAAAILFTVLATSCCLPQSRLLGNIYHGYAREEDGESRRFNVWSSWLLGIYGIGLIDGLCRDMVITRTAALILGIGDGLAEPIGKRFGRYTFPVLRLPRMAPQRKSIEGSLTVAAGTFATVLFVFCLDLPFLPLLSLSFTVALATMLAEALSPHGTDNFTIPVVGGLAIRFHSAYSVIGGIALVSDL